MTHKYGAKRTEVDGITFHSQKEARRYQELRLMEKAGVIANLVLQPEYPLNTWHGDHSVAPKVGVYRADFRYMQLEIDEGGFSGRWREVVEDVKGYDTPLSKWKRKHVAAQYGIEVRIT